MQHLGLSNPLFHPAFTPLAGSFGPTWHFNDQFMTMNLSDLDLTCISPGGGPCNGCMSYVSDIIAVGHVYGGDLILSISLIRRAWPKGTFILLYIVFELQKAAGCESTCPPDGCRLANAWSEVSKTRIWWHKSFKKLLFYLRWKNSANYDTSRSLFCSLDCAKHLATHVIWNTAIAPPHCLSILPMQPPLNAAINIIGIFGEYRLFFFFFFFSRNEITFSRMRQRTRIGPLPTISAAPSLNYIHVSFRQHQCLSSNVELR